jgi:pilus assembly protein Flp/PilA
MEEQDERREQAMQKLFHAARWFWKARAGQDLVEYALMAGFVAVAAGAVFPTSVMPAVSGIFSAIDNVLAQAP